MVISSCDRKKPIKELCMQQKYQSLNDVSCAFEHQQHLDNDVSFCSLVDLLSAELILVWRLLSYWGSEVQRDKNLHKVLADPKGFQWDLCLEKVQITPFEVMPQSPAADH